MPARHLAGFVFFTALLLASPGRAAEPALEFPPHVLRNTELRALPHSANGSDYLLYVALQFIIVGFGYQGTHTNAEYDVLRRPDYAPPPQGQADKFLGVVEREIIPFIEKNYRVDPSYRVLSGNSLGGCFSLDAMLARPGLFQAHVAASPAVPKALFDLEEKIFASNAKLSARLFMTDGEKEAPDFVANMVRLNERLTSRHYPDLAFQWRLLDGEGHTGTKAETYSRGLRFAFVPIAPKK